MNRNVHRRSPRPGDGQPLPEALALMTVLRLSIGEAVTSEEIRQTAEVLCRAWQRPEPVVVHYLEELVRIGRTSPRRAAA
jgi:hypothetical protein